MMDMAMARPLVNDPKVSEDDIDAFTSVAPSHLSLEYPSQTSRVASVAAIERTGASACIRAAHQVKLGPTIKQLGLYHRFTKGLGLDGGDCRMEIRCKPWAQRRHRRPPDQAV
jgi:hypothetical protein